MKKFLPFFIILILLSPVIVSASSFTAEDMTIAIDDSEWYVFTRSNISSNSELDDLNISYDYMNDFFETNNAYIDSLKINDDNSTVELIIAAKKVNIKSNLNKYSNSEIKVAATEFIKRSGANDYEIYNSNGYTYIKVEYSDSGYNIIDYYTIMNGQTYTIKFQSSSSISSSNKQEFDLIVDSISFNYIASYDKKEESLFQKAIYKGLVGACIGAIVSVIGFFSNRNKKNSCSQTPQKKAKKIKVESD